MARECSRACSHPTTFARFCHNKNFLPQGEGDNHPQTIAKGTSANFFTHCTVVKPLEMANQPVYRPHLFNLKVPIFHCPTARQYHKSGLIG
jgi:hypothetical protein